MAVKKIAPARPRLLTVAEWAQLPDGDQYELIDGLLRQRMVNQNRHEYTVGRAAQILNNHLDDAEVAGSVLGSNTKYEVRPRQGIMPDLSVVLSPKVDQLDAKAAYNAFGPDLAVEILSPDQGEEYVKERLGDYWALGTAEVWVVDPEAETVVGYGRGSAEFEVFARARGDQEFRSRLLPELSFPVNRLWMRGMGGR